MFFLNIAFIIIGLVLAFAGKNLYWFLVAASGFIGGFIIGTAVLDIDNTFLLILIAIICGVIGANDVINPAAREDQTSPIYGMPILDVDKARNVIIIKRSLNPGFAGVDNALFYDPKTLMFFNGARQAVQEIVGEVKKL